MTSLVDKFALDDLWAVIQPLLPSPPRGGLRRAAGLCACLRQVALTRQQERTTSNTTNASDTTPYRNHGSTSTRNSPPGARATSMSLVMSSKQASHSTATRGLDVP